MPCHQPRLKAVKDATRWPAALLIILTFVAILGRCAADGSHHHHHLLLKQQQQGGSPASIYDQVDRDLLPLKHGAVILGCVATNCTKPHGTPAESNEDAIARRFDMLLNFIHPPKESVAGKVVDDPNYLRHHSWELCHADFDPSCRWRDIADGKRDADLIVPAARHIASLQYPFVFSVCNEMMAQGPTGKFRFAGTARDYLDMFAHIKRVFEQHNASKNVVWSWNTFNEPAINKHGQPGSTAWDKWYPGDENVSWVGINAFTGFATGGNVSYDSLKELYAEFYAWVAPKRVHPFFHAFGTSENLVDPTWKQKFFDAIPQLLGPGNVYEGIRACCIFSGDYYDIQTSAAAATGARHAFNQPVFDAFGRTNRTR